VGSRSSASPSNSSGPACLSADPLSTRANRLGRRGSRHGSGELGGGSAPRRGLVVLLLDERVDGRGSIGRVCKYGHENGSLGRKLVIRRAADGLCSLAQDAWQRRRARGRKPARRRLDGAQASDDSGGVGSGEWPAVTVPSGRRSAPARPRTRLPAEAFGPAAQGCCWPVLAACRQPACRQPARRRGDDGRGSTRHRQRACRLGVRLGRPQQETEIAHTGYMVLGRGT
jgi:hypothetical protein